MNKQDEGVGVATLERMGQERSHRRDSGDLDDKKEPAMCLEYSAANLKA